ncbi:MAG: hypothetical protein RLZZ232_1367 [Planctomycetota bacterium]|jgi:hypothetical protein
MINMKVKQAKGFFFDRRRVTSAVDKATRTRLSRFGAFVRTAARSSIRRRKASSKPGQPPSSHTGLLKQHIYFIYEPNNRSVVIGPAFLNERQQSPPVPELLENGGLVYRTGVSMFYEPRPYMRPAFDQEMDNLEKLWRNSVR